MSINGGEEKDEGLDSMLDVIENSQKVCACVF